MAETRTEMLAFIWIGHYFIASSQIAKPLIYFELASLMKEHITASSCCKDFSFLQREGQAGQPKLLHSISYISVLVSVIGIRISNECGKHRVSPANIRTY